VFLPAAAGIGQPRHEWSEREMAKNAAPRSQDIQLPPR